MHRLRYTSNLGEAEFHERCCRQKVWYHSFYFDNGFEIRGDYNIGADILDYGLPQDLTGQKVLDIGTGAGWFAFYFEQLGAREVITTDARGKCDLDVYGRWEYLAPGANGRQPERCDEDGSPVYDSVLSGAFWVMKEILGSNVKFRNARVYEISPAMFGGGKFDLVYMGALLCHVRDPIGALMAARSVCRGRVFVSTPVVIGEPESETPPRQYLPHTGVHDVAWWLPNEACFRHWFQAAGFREVDISRRITLRCDVPCWDKTGRQCNQDQIHRVGIARV